MANLPQTDTVKSPWRRYRLSSVNWLLLVLGSISFYTMWRYPCEPSHSSLGPVLGAVTLCLIAWSNHVRHGTIHSFKALLAVMLGTFYDVVLLVLVTGVLAAILLPAYQCYTPRAKVTEAMVLVTPLKAEITERVAQRRSISGSGSELRLPDSKNIAGGAVSSDGQIIVVTKDPPASIILTPSFDANEVQWQCKGYPSKVVPLPCRDPQ